MWRRINNDHRLTRKMKAKEASARSYQRLQTISSSIFIILTRWLQRLILQRSYFFLFQHILHGCQSLCLHNSIFFALIINFGFTFLCILLFFSLISIVSSLLFTYLIISLVSLSLSFLFFNFSLSFLQKWILFFNHILQGLQLILISLHQHALIF